MRTRVRLFGTMLAGLAVSLSSGCSKAKESAPSVEVSETAKIWTEATQVLSKVTDKQTADDARPKLLELAGRMRKVIEDKAKKEEETARVAHKRKNHQLPLLDRTRVLHS